MELRVLYQDEGLIAIDKPPGVLVHRTKLDVHERTVVVQALRDQIGKKVYPLHRLDKPTSGVLLFALDSATARSVGDLFASRAIRKTYHAIVRGWTAAEDVIDYPLKVIRDKTTDSDTRPDKPPQQAVSRYRSLGHCTIDTPVGRYETARYTLLELTPETGRKNQLRRHLKHIFHPIIGDRKFGDRDHNAYFRDNLDCDRLLLSAVTIELLHPTTNQTISISCDSGFPEEITAFFDG